MACPPWRCRRPPRSSGWDPLNEAHPAARCLEWRSARLGNHRRVWIYTTGEAVDPQTRPLAILLDGQFWAESMPVWSPLAALTREGETAAGGLPADRRDRQPAPRG